MLSVRSVGSKAGRRGLVMAVRSCETLGHRHRRLPTEWETVLSAGKPASGREGPQHLAGAALRVGAEALGVGHVGAVDPDAVQADRAAGQAGGAGRQVVRPPLGAARDRRRDRTASGRRPGLRFSRPRSWMPNSLAGWPLRRCTACAVSSTPRSRLQWPSRCRPKPASQKKVRCAPASRQRDVDVGIGQDLADLLVVVVQQLRHEQRVEVLRQREVEDAVERVLAGLLRKIGERRALELAVLLLRRLDDEQLVPFAVEQQAAAPLVELACAPPRASWDRGRSS